jgi:hypothetical protein
MRLFDRKIALYAIDANGFAVGCDADTEDMASELLEESLEAAVLCFYAELADRGHGGRFRVTVDGVQVMPATDLTDCTRRLYPEPEPVESF